VDPDAFRAEFPVLERLAYLNTGTDGPLPLRSAHASAARVERELRNGRSGARHFGELGRLNEQLREAIARLLGASPDETALTRSTSDGLNVVLAGLALGPGDEVVTSDEEHPGLLAPLGRLRRRGVRVRVAPFARIADAVDERTRLVAVSHVSWLSGSVAPVDRLKEAGVPVLLDGAQALGAMPVDVRSLGCSFYASAGQKWLCGPDATGALFVARGQIEALGVPWPSYTTLGDPGRPLELHPATGARRFDGGMVSGPLVAGALASIEVLETAGWEWVFERGRAQAAKLRALLAGRAELVPGGETTLVSWRPASVRDDRQAHEAVARLAEQGVVVRSFPGHPLIRASVGAWSSDADLERLVAAC
jgi:selenocysteine lyase/cysteine desulfurase